MSSVSSGQGESSSAMLTAPSSEENKPLIVRVKRKPSHSIVDAFWLEVNERPLKRPLLDFQNLSLSDSHGKKLELRSKKVFVKHVETTNSSETANELLHSLLPRYSEVSTSELKIAERRSTFKKEMIKEELLTKAREAKEVSTKNARFEQIWRSRNKNKVVKNDEGLHEMCNFYEVARVDGEDKSMEVAKEEDMSLEDQMLLSSYLPLLRDLLPSAAAEIETDLSSNASKQGPRDDYVYDYYVVHDGPEVSKEHVSTAYPLVQVDEEDDFYDGPDSEYDSDDSNAENNPMFDYPDEISDDEEIESESDSAVDEEEEAEGKEEGSDESADLSSSSEEHIHRFSDFEDDNDNVYDEDVGCFGFEDGNDSDE